MNKTTHNLKERPTYIGRKRNQNRFKIKVQTHGKHITLQMKAETTSIPNIKIKVKQHSSEFPLHLLLGTRIIKLKLAVF